MALGRMEITMQNNQESWETNLSSNNLAWPDYPDILSTLLTAVSVAGIFLGLGTLTNETWFTWLGLVLSAGVLGYHIIRYRQIIQQRTDATQILGAQLISHCRYLGGSDFMKMQRDNTERVVLVLTDDALHVGHREPLNIFASLPVYNINDAQVGHLAEPKWNTDSVPPELSQQEDVLNLAVHMRGSKIYHLAFYDFEKEVPSSVWANRIGQMIIK